MYRYAGILVGALTVTSCAGGLATLEQDLARAAQEQLMKTLANHYTRELGKGVGVVVYELAQPGGYLDNPLVRILLPPPVALALDIARELHTDPQAGLLDVLINQAAEQAIPGAAPILRAAITQITQGDVRTLLGAGRTAGTEHLKAKTTAALQEALSPLVAAALAANGAQQLYADLLAPQQAQRIPGPPAETVPSAPLPDILQEHMPDELPSAAAPDLGDYVTEQAVEGLFKVLGAHEARIRDDLDSATGALLQETVREMYPAPAEGRPGLR